MTAPGSQHRPLSPPSAEARLFCGVSLLFVAAWLMFLSWLPFEWDFTASAIVERLSHGLLILETHRLVGRIMLLTTLGALWSLRNPGRPLRTLLILLVVCTALEASQALLFNRHPRAGDLAVSMLAASVGLLLAHQLAVRGRALHPRALAGAARGGTLLLAGVMLWCAFEAPAVGSFVGWNRDLLLFGASERDGRASWEGCLTHLEIIPGLVQPDRTAAESAEAVRLHEASPGCLPSGYLVNEARATALQDAIMAASAFTVRLTLASYPARPAAQLRIVGLTKRRWQQNLVLAQQGDALVVRVRTPLNGVNAGRNQAVWPGVFSGRVPLELSAVVHNGQARLSVAGGPFTAPDHLENVAVAPLARLGGSLLWSCVLVLVPFGFYWHWAAAPAAAGWRAGVAGSGLFLLALTGAWFGARYWQVPFQLPLPAALAVPLVPLTAAATRRLVTRARL